MIIPPNTTNQIKIQDIDGDEAWFDVIGQEVVVTVKVPRDTIHVAGDHVLIPVLLARQDVVEVIAHIHQQLKGA